MARKRYSNSSADRLHPALAMPQDLTNDGALAYAMVLKIILMEMSTAGVDELYNHFAGHVFFRPEDAREADLVDLRPGALLVVAYDEDSELAQLVLGPGGDAEALAEELEDDNFYIEETGDPRFSVVYSR